MQAKTPAKISGLGEIADQYDVFFLDQFGVLHDGRKPYDGVVAALENLHRLGKQLVVLTNSGKRAAPNLSRLIEMGFPHGVISAVVSSGEVAWRGISAGSFGAPFVADSKVYIIGRSGDDYGVDDLGLHYVDRPEAANFLMIMGSNTPKTSLDEYAALLKPAAMKHIPALCANPDIWMVTSTGLHPAPGAIGRVYQNLGGRVRYIGKPYADIYELALTTCSAPNKARAVAVGDSVEHDILGAAQFGISSVLVRTGVLASATTQELSRKYEEDQAWPDFVISQFGW